MHPENRITNNGQGQLIDLTLNGPPQDSAGSSQQGSAFHVNYQQAPVSANLYNNIAFTQSLSDATFQQSSANTGNTRNLILPFAHSAAHSIVSSELMTRGSMQYPLVMSEHLRDKSDLAITDFPADIDPALLSQVDELSKTSYSGNNRDGYQHAVNKQLEHSFDWYNKMGGREQVNSLQPALAQASQVPPTVATNAVPPAYELNTAQLNALPDGDRTNLAQYARMGAPQGVEYSVWKSECDTLVAFSKYLRETCEWSIAGITSVARNGAVQLFSCAGQLPEKELTAFHNALSSYLSFCSQQQTYSSQDALQSGASDGYLTDNGSAAVPGVYDDTMWSVGSMDLLDQWVSEITFVEEISSQISSRTGIPAANILRVSFDDQVIGFPLFTSNATVTHNSVAEQDIFLRHAKPVIDKNGNGMASFHLGDTAYSAFFEVDRGTGEVKYLDFMAETLDAGRAHPDTMTIEQLARSVRNRHALHWLSEAENNIEQRTGIKASAIEYVHYLGNDDDAPLFMTKNTAASVNCDPEALADFFCYVQPTLYRDGDGEAWYIQNGEMHSVGLKFNTKTYEITDFRLSKPMYVDLT